MANNFNDAQVSLTDDTLTDVYTASNKSLVIAGTISNTTTTSMNVSIKKYDNSATAGKIHIQRCTITKWFITRTTKNSFSKF